jgi:hypothetical protein
MWLYRTDEDKGYRNELARNDPGTENRGGRSWMYQCEGGWGVISATGELLASSNTEGKEAVLVYELDMH